MDDYTIPILSGCIGLALGLSGLSYYEDEKVRWMKCAEGCVKARERAELEISLVN